MLIECFTKPFAEVFWFSKVASKVLFVVSTSREYLVGISPVYLTQSTLTTFSKKGYCFSIDCLNSLLFGNEYLVSVSLYSRKRKKKYFVQCLDSALKTFMAMWDLAAGRSLSDLIFFLDRLCNSYIVEYYPSKINGNIWILESGY